MDTGHGGSSGLTLIGSPQICVDPVKWPLFSLCFNIHVCFSALAAL